MPIASHPSRCAQALAALLTTDKEPLLASWSRRVLDDPVVPMANRLSHPELRDDVPKIISCLIDTLEQHEGTGPDAETEGRHVGTTKPSVRHGMMRFSQGYSLAAGLRELSHLRLALLQLCLDKGLVLNHETTQLVHAALDELMAQVASEIAEREHALLHERARLLELEGDVALALVDKGGLRETLQRCTEALVRHVDAAFARIWTLNEAQNMLEMQASAGLYTHLDGPHGRVPVGHLKIGMIAKERRPHLTNTVLGDPRVPDQDWAKSEGLVAFAGYPLLVDGCLVGVIALFARKSLDDTTLRAMKSIGNGIALGIDRQRKEDALRASQGWLATTLTSIGEGVIATDAEGRIAFMNPVACALTGWTSVEAQGRPVADVFRIYNEQTREVVENLVDKVLRENRVIMGLVCHPVLLRKEGGEVPIDHSAAPMLAQDGHVVGVVLVFRGVEEKRHKELERQKLVSVIENSSDFIGISDLDGRGWFVNEAGQRLVGLEGLDEVRQHSIIDRFFPEDQKYVREEILPRVLEEGRWEGEIRFRHFRTGAPIPVLWNVFTIRNPSTGSLTALATVTRDMRTQHAINAEKERLFLAEQTARRDAEIASRSKDEFLATASHELRTPVNAILGWARMLGSGDLGANDHKKGLEIIERNAKVQVQLIEDILDGSRIITGKLRLEVRPLDLSEVVHAALEAIRPSAEAKSIRLDAVLEPTAVRMVGDPDRLQQVVWNLVSNAIKFTPKCGRVDLRLERVESEIALTVRDTGQGIEPNFLPHVFDRFRQAEGSTTRRFGGLGLGLALVRHLVEAHGGTVHVESAGKGHGATFTVSLPVQAVYAERAQSERPTPIPSEEPAALSATQLEGICVLIVDDEEDARALVSTVLALRGATVMEARSVDEALQQLKTQLPDVLVSDIGMPGTDGYALMESIRAHEKGTDAALPAVALTAYARAEDRRRALDAGYQMYVSKPVEPAELVRVVSALVGRRSVL